MHTVRVHESTHEVTSALVRLAQTQTQELQLAENLAVRQW